MNTIERAEAVTDVVCLDVSGMTTSDAVLACAPRVATGAVVVARIAAGDEVTKQACLRIGCYHAIEVDATVPVLSAVVAGAAVTARRQRDQTRGVALRAVRRGEMELRTPDDAVATALLLSELMPDPSRAALGLGELMINAIEHGNLGIGCRLKTELLLSGDLPSEIARRIELPEYRERRAHVTLERDEMIRITIRDEGAGFDWRTWADRDLEASTSLHGRGIALVHALHFARIEYREPGNVVVVTTEPSW